MVQKKQGPLAYISWKEISMNEKRKQNDRKKTWLSFKKEKTTLCINGCMLHIKMPKREVVATFKIKMIIKNAYLTKHIWGGRGISWEQSTKRK